MTWDLTYLSLGAGVQSSALLVMALTGDRGVPKPDVAIFSDTMQEPAHVYESVERLREFAARYDVQVVTVSHGDLLQDAIDRFNGTKRRYASIPTWVKGADGRAAPGRRQCTREYKIDPITREVRRRLGYEPGQRVKKRARALIGISIDEWTRMKPSRTHWIDNVYPLVERRIDRRECERIVVAAGLPMPRKSACVFCPYTDNRRWLEMQREDPESFARAVAADVALRDQSRAGLRQEGFVHRSLRPLAEIDFKTLVEQRDALPLFDGRPDDADSGGFENECEGMCGI